MAETITLVDDDGGYLTIDPSDDGNVAIIDASGFGVTMERGNELFDELTRIFFPELFVEEEATDDSEQQAN